MTVNPPNCAVQLKNSFFSIMWLCGLCSCHTFEEWIWSGPLENMSFPFWPCDRLDPSLCHTFEEWFEYLWLQIAPWLPFTFPLSHLPADSGPWPWPHLSPPPSFSISPKMDNQKFGFLNFNFIWISFKQIIINFHPNVLFYDEMTTQTIWRHIQLHHQYYLKSIFFQFLCNNSIFLIFTFHFLFLRIVEFVSKFNQNLCLCKQI